ncbi:hypothetical protein M9H77_13249 [Catharanthus roseus]|uniref:Uncharacterized protein n=1 Tax=Catharanthus roseus TaxID=4058 RepID=A0ACC0BJT5_CATRO|nr:hypothetical protein M9H77_13249 [Catharanthus roseus]
MEGNHIYESGGELMLNDGGSEEDELREGSDDSMSRFMLPYISLSTNVNRKLEMHDRARLRHNKSVRIFEVQAGGLDKFGCLPRDCRNYVQKVRKLNIGAWDVDCINRMFIRIHQKDSDFFHLIRMDEEVAYEEFNDVVCVNLMYLVSRYKMPFLAIMGGQAPGAIMIDQCESVGNAIKEVMPTTIQRYCICHIICKLPDKFKGLME